MMCVGAIDGFIAFSFISRACARARRNEQRRAEKAGSEEMGLCSW